MGNQTALALCLKGYHERMLVETAVETNGAVRLNIGAGPTKIDGFIPVDRKNGQEAYPLAYADGSVDEIYASHVLEHFSHTETQAVLQEWTRVLKPGGRMRIAVPDFDKLDKSDPKWPYYLMGGHVDSNDRHGAVFTKQLLTEKMELAGIGSLQPFDGTYGDCASLPVSLNLEGVKGENAPTNTCPEELQIKIAAVTSIPRVGWNDHWGCVIDALRPFRIPIRRHTGAYWDHGMQEMLEDCVDAGIDWVLALDYDTMFTSEHLDRMLYWFGNCPEIDALAAYQCRRCNDRPLLTVGNKTETDWDGNPIKVDTAHFGMTLIRTECLKTLPKPWLVGKPNSDGRWSEGQVDPDIYFWHIWKDAGNSCYVAPDVRVGHLELMVSGFDENMKWEATSIVDWRKRNGHEIKSS